MIPHEKRDVRAPIISMPGLLLLGVQRDLIACNSEAVNILAFPEKPGKGKQLTTLVNEKIPMELRAALPGRTVAEFMSGRRRYVCTRHTLDMPGANKGASAILLERVLSPEVTLYAMSKKYNLTPREREAIGHLFRGLTGKEIAREMNISPNTVKASLRLIMTKMGVNTRAGLVGRIAGTTATDLQEARELEGLRR